MIHHWPWWLGGLALAGVALTHWFVLGRQMAVSGRFTAIVNRWRFGAPDPGARALENASRADLLAAIQAATHAEFGAEEEAASPEDSRTPASITRTRKSDGEARGALSPIEPGTEPSAVPVRRVRTLAEHAVFLGSLALGGLCSALLAGSLEFSLAPGGEIFAALFAKTPWGGALVLLIGGMLVGAGTRMAAGCTSGHGLCGVSRLQPGSLLATLAFFGAAVATAFVLKGLS